MVRDVKTTITSKTNQSRWSSWFLKSDKGSYQILDQPIRKFRDL